MPNFSLNHKTGFHAFKGIPENVQEFNETMAFFLEEQAKLDGKRVSAQRIANVRKIFDGLEQTRKLAEREGKSDLLEVLDRKSEELEHYRSELETGERLMKEFTTLMSRVVLSSDKYVVRAKKFLTGNKSQEILDLENFLIDYDLKSSDFDHYDLERLKRYGVTISAD
jgi:hypothetical protein